MANLKVLDGDGAAKYIKASGAGTDGDPFVVERQESGSTAVTLYNKELTVADTEYSQALPATCRKLVFQCREAELVRYAFVTGKVAAPTAPYMTLKVGAAFDSGIIHLSSATLYLASSTAGANVEIEAWS